MNKAYPVFFGLVCLLLSFSTRVDSQCTPHSPNMLSSDNNSTAFGTDGALGTDNGLTYYVHWDNVNLYLGWSGGNYVYSSDMFYAAIDIDPSTSNGSSTSIEGVGFSDPALDYYIVYENNQWFYGNPVGNGNAFEVYFNTVGTWNFSSRTIGDDNNNSQVVFANPGEVRLKVPWTQLGGFTPGAANDLKIVMWANNSDGNYMWSSFPANTPGSVPKTLSEGILYSGTGAGTCPSAGINAPLPVELTSLQARANENYIDLSWSTASETNNSHFEIERSSDALHWLSIATVEGKGTSATNNNYEITDNNPTTGTNYYRLKQVDFDGRFEYSNIVQATIKKTSGTIYPNPVTDYFFVSTENTKPGDYIDLYTMQGALLKTTFIDNNLTTKINCQQLPTGGYFLIIRTKEGSLKNHQRFVKK